MFVLPTLCYFCSKVITIFLGKSRDAIIIHHLNGNGKDNRPENLVPAHNGCHMKYHNKKENRGPEWGTGFAVAKRKLIESFRGNPICCFCQNSITKLNGQDSESLCIHHINDDDDDNRPENLIPSHIGCHMTYHSEKRGISPEAREKIKRTLIGHPVSEETRNKITNSLIGKPLSKQCRENLSRALTGRILSIEHREKMRNCMTTEEKSIAAKKGWITRKENHGPSGGNKNNWKTRLGHRQLTGI